MLFQGYLERLLVPRLVGLGVQDLTNIKREDTSPWMGCYGDDINEDATPNIDAIAEAAIIILISFFSILSLGACT